MKEVPRKKADAKRERLRYEWEWLHQKAMECKDWNYPIWSYYFREGRKREQTELILEKNSAKFDYWKGNLYKSLRTL